MEGSGEMRKAISEVVGRADAKDGGGCRVYRALRALLCARCGEVIAEGQLFTRRSVYGGGWQVYPHCQRCAPFQWRKDEGERAASTLLSSLFDGPKRPSEVTRQERAATEVQLRLGPALARARRRRA